jgi:hypothetical protein
MNKNIVNLIEERLEKGKRQYSEELDVNDGREWTQESLEEALDLSVYLSAEILRRKEVPYRYLTTSHFEDREDVPVVIKSKQPMDWEEIQYEVGYKMNDDTYGGATHDWEDVYISICYEVKPFGKCFRIFKDGFIRPEDIIK